MRIEAPIPKNPASKAKFAITFPQGFKKSKKLGQWTSGSMRKKAFKRSEQMKKFSDFFFLPLQFYTFYEQKFSNLRPLLSIIFPQGF